MKSIKKIIDSLELIYYNYDEKNMAFVPAHDVVNKNAIYNELIKITHTLSKNGIKYLSSDNQVIFLNSKNTLLSKLKMRANTYLQKFANSNQDIYILSEKETQWAKNLPMIKIEPTKIEIAYTNYDALIFTSKNAIVSLNKFDSRWKAKPLYAIAPQTAKTALNLGGKVRFVGKTKHGDEFAYELIDQLKGKKALYIRGDRSVSDITNILNTNGVICDEAIVYRTLCVEYKEKILLPKDSVIIFSSPSTIECFFKNATWDESYKAISIGHTTKKYFPDHIKPIIAKTTSLESCVEAALELNKNKG